MPLKASLEERRVRASKPKVRSGCSTCKTRRIKCDENRPLCGGCQKTNRHCGYLDNQDTRSKTQQDFLPIRPKMEVRPTRSQVHSYQGIVEDLAQNARQWPMISPNPSVALATNEPEQRYVHLFMGQVIFDLCGYFENPFWTKVVLQESHREPTVRLQILALSSLYKSTLCDGEAKEEHRQFSLVQQGKSIQMLRERVSQGVFPLRLALVASLVLANLESLHGNWETSVAQAAASSRLLKVWSERSQHMAPKKVATMDLPSNIDPELFSIIARTDLQLMCYLAMNNISDEYFPEIYRAPTINWIPRQFDAVQDALPSANRLALVVMLNLRRCHQIKMHRPFQIPEWLVQESAELFEKSVQWKEAFSRVWKEGTSSDAKHAHIGGYLFIMYEPLFEVMMSTNTTTDETAYDGLYSCFEESSGKAEELLRLDKSTFSSAQKMRMSFNIGAVMALFYMATRCRDHSLRHRAVKLLRDYPSRNGIWDSNQAYQIADWVISLEEEGIDDKLYIPEGARVRMHSLKWIIVGDWIEVECLQGPADGEWTMRKSKLLRRLQ